MSAQDQQPELQKLLDELRKSEEHFRSVLDSSRDVIYRLNLQTTRYEYVSPSAEAMLGYSPAEFMAMDAELALTMVHPDDLPATRAAFAQALRAGEGEAEYRQRTRSGEYRWLSNRISVTRDEAGRPLYRDGSIRDITERKAAEEERERLLESARESEDRYRQLFEHMSEAFLLVEIIKDESGNPVDYLHLVGNRALDGFIGMKHEQLVGKTRREALGSESPWMERFVRVARTGRPERWEDFSAAFKRHFYVNAYSPRPDQVACVFEDITERKAAETEKERLLETVQNQAEQLQIQNEELQVQSEELESQNEELLIQGKRMESLLAELRESEQKFVTMFEKAPYAAALSRLPGGVIVNVNEAFEKAFGYSEQEAVGRTTLELGINTDRESRARAVAELEEHGATYDVDLTLRTRSGEERHFSNSILVVDIGGEKHLLSMAQDVTERRRAEVALRESEEQLKEQARVLDLAHILIRDPDSCVVTWNSGAEALYGFSREEALGRDSHDLLRTVFPESRQAVDEALARDGYWEGELVHTAKDGRKVVVASHQVLHRDEAGRPIAILEANNDITQLKQLETERERLLAELAHQVAELDATIESILDGVVIYDEAGNIVHMNRAARRILGYSPGALPGPIVDRISRLRVESPDGEPFPADEVPAVKALRGEVAPSVVMVWHLASGETIWVSVSAAPITSPERTFLGAVTTFTDITALHELQEQMAKLLVAEQEARAQAETAVKVRDQFISVAAHELKTPVTSLRGFAQVMQRELANDGKVDPARLAKSMYRIDQQSKRLSKLTDQLLDLSRLREGKVILRMEETDTSQVVERLVSDLRQASPGRSIELRDRSAGPVLVDPLRFEQVLTNLIDNAFKFSPSGSPVEIEMENPEQGWLEISVTDHGIGVPEGEEERIFERFHQAHPDRHAGGMGIGLSICREIAEMHGGSVRLERREGQGSCFILRIPANR